MDPSEPEPSSSRADLKGPVEDEWWKGFINVVKNEDDTSEVIYSVKWLEHSLKKASTILITHNSDRRKQILDYITESPLGMHRLVFALKHSLTAYENVDISSILRQTVNPRNKKNRYEALKYLILGDYASQLIQILVELQETMTMTADPLLMKSLEITNNNVIWFLLPVACKDPRFAHKVRLQSKIKFMHGLVRKNFQSTNNTHFPLLKILKVLSRNPDVSLVLGKDKVMSTVNKMLNKLGNSPSAKFLLVIEILAYLTKEKSNIVKFLKTGLLPKLNRTFSYWQTWKGKGLHKFSKYILNIYSHVAKTKTGKRGLVKTEAMNNLRKLCEGFPNDKFFDLIVSKSYGIMSMSVGKHKLPFSDPTSPLRFALPMAPEMEEGASSSDEDEPDEEIDGSDFSDEDPLDDDTDDDFEIAYKDDEFVELVPISPTFKDSKESIQDLGDENLKKDFESKAKATENLASKPLKEDEMENLLNFAQFFSEFDGNLKYETELYKRFPQNSILFELPNGSFLQRSAYEKELKAGSHESKLPIFRGDSETEEIEQVYLHIANKIHSVSPFVKIAYPDMQLAGGKKKMEFLTPFTDRNTTRRKIINGMARTCGVDKFKPRTIFDLDQLMESSPLDKDHKLTNIDESIVGVLDKKTDNLFFESRFESGNLRKAVQVGEREYDIYLTSDVNSKGRNQWFYFQVSNVVDSVAYTFNIVNCVKVNSQFNYGMQPLVYSVSGAIEGRGGWFRSGSNICYFRNGYVNSHSKKTKCYYTASFNITFKYRGDVCYLAFHYPYTYTRMLTEIWKAKKQVGSNVLFRYDVLCQTMNKNEVPLLTITAPNNSKQPIELRDVIFLTARVHPGESNASWVMAGVIQKLLFSHDMEKLLKKYVFKIVPMLNCEGVLNGCNRCGLTNEDLNRRWKNPNPVLHDSIYFTKSLIEFSCRVRHKVPILYCDIHGHSRKKNAFFFGCSRARSWNTDDRCLPENPNDHLALPETMSRISHSVSLTNCHFDVKRNRESTARVALWRQFGITKSYTLESSFCGFDRGPLKGQSLGVHHLYELGEKLCNAIDEMDNPVKSISDYKVDLSQDIPDVKESHMNLFIEESSWKPLRESSSSSCSDSEAEATEWDENQELINPIFTF